MTKIHANMILEILGRPKEHIESTLKGLVEKLSKEAGVKVISNHVHEAVKVEDAEDLFTSFVEISLEMDSLAIYFNIMFAYMPSNIEIIEPENLALKAADMNFIGNRLTQRLHDYDALVKDALMKKDILAKKLFEFAPHLFKKQTPEEQSVPLRDKQNLAEKLEPIQAKEEIKEAKKNKKSKNKKSKNN